MVPLQTILLLIVACAPQLAEGNAPGVPAPLPHFALMTLVTFLLSHLALSVLVLNRTQQALRLLHQTSADSAIITSRIDTLISRARWATLAITALYIFLFQLPQILQHFLDQAPFLRTLDFLPPALFMTPALLAWLVFWTAGYQIESATRQRALPYRLAQGLPVHEMPPLGRYLSMQVRHNLFPILPIAIHVSVVAACDFLSRHGVPYAADVAPYVGMFAVFLLLPWLLTKIWSTTPLAGPLRQRLDAIAKQHRLRFRNILLWHTHNVVTNAAILGYLPFARYFFMTDGLVESLTDRQLEAVFAHEVGHGVHRHLPWYFVFFIACSAFASSAAMIAQAFLPYHWAVNLGGAEMAGTAAMGLVFAAGFPFFSHRFEHQADWFAARHMAQMLRGAPQPSGSPSVIFDPHLQGFRDVELMLPSTATPTEQISLQQYAAGRYPHAASNDPTAAGALANLLPAARIEPTSPPAPLETLPAGAEIFISSLDTLIEVNHRSRNRAGWMHPSINNRIGLLRRLAADPGAAAAFDAKMRHTRWLILATLALGIGSVPLADRLLPAPPAAPAPQAPAQAALNP